MPPKKRDKSPRRADPPELRAIKNDIKLERKYRQNAYNGVLLVRQGDPNEAMVFQAISWALQDVWARDLSKPFIVPKGTTQVVFVGRAPPQQACAQFSARPQSRLLCTVDTEIPAYVPESALIQATSYYEAVCVYLDEAMPGWRNKINLDWLAYYAAQTVNYEGLSEEEKRTYRKILFGIEEIRAMPAELAHSWCDDMREKAERQLDDAELDAKLAALRAEAGRADKAYFRPNGDPEAEQFEARFIRHRSVEHPVRKRLYIDPSPSHQREIFNLFLDDPANAKRMLIFCDQRHSSTRDTPRNVTIYCPAGTDFSDCPNFCSGEPGKADFLFVNEDEMQRQIVI
jgi:hypothetical protein